MMVDRGEAVKPRFFFLLTLFSFLHYFFFLSVKHLIYFRNQSQTVQWAFFIREVFINYIFTSRKSQSFLLFLWITSREKQTTEIKYLMYIIVFGLRFWRPNLSSNVGNFSSIMAIWIELTLFLMVYMLMR